MGKEPAHPPLRLGNSMERRIGEDMAELKHDVAELKHDMHLLDVKIDVPHRVTDEKLDWGFRQIMEHLQ